MVPYCMADAEERARPRLRHVAPPDAVLRSAFLQPAFRHPTQNAFKFNDCCGPRSAAIHPRLLAWPMEPAAGEVFICIYHGAQARSFQPCGVEAVEDAVTGVRAGTLLAPVLVVSTERASPTIRMHRLLALDEAVAVPAHETAFQVNREVEVVPRSILYRGPIPSRVLQCDGNAVQRVAAVVEHRSYRMLDI